VAPHAIAPVTAIAVIGSAASETVVMLARNDPSHTPNATPGPHKSTAASAIPAAGHTAAA
jgi:hypothetical protein